MSAVAANWVSVGDRRHFQAVPVCSAAAWPVPEPGVRVLAAPAPFGGPVAVLEDGALAHIHSAAGQELARWRWKGGRVVDVGWSNDERAFFVTDDGTVMIYDLFGKFVRSFSMGREAKDLKVSAARVFRSRWATGVAVLTTARRFFVVNNADDPRVRKMPDLELATKAAAVPWCVLVDERHAKVAVATDGGEVAVLSSHSQEPEMLLQSQGDESRRIVRLTPSYDGASLAALCQDGRLLIRTGSGKTSSFELGSSLPSSVVWCSSDSLVVIWSSLCQMRILTAAGDRSDDVFLEQCLSSVQEVDGAKLFTSDGQKMVQEVPDCLHATFSIGSVAPSAMLFAAAEEFAHKSHKADEYLRSIRDKVDSAVEACIECAGEVRDVDLQKELLKAAQFGKYFISRAETSALPPSGDAFTKTCLALRILNNLRGTLVGMPLTYAQYNYLTPPVVLDRLLARRLYPLALEMAKLLKLSVDEGESRVLAHWACYKVGQEPADGAPNDVQVAKTIYDRLGRNPKISYSDIAAKAADCGRKNLAIRILEHESRVAKQVPLLVQLGQESTALSKAINSGDRDLAFSVLLHLKTTMPSADFHIMIRKYPLGRTLYRTYCRQLGDSDSLEEWFLQEDDFASLAVSSFEQAMQTHRYESRVAGLLRVQEYWQKSKQESLQALTDEQLKLLKQQSALEDKLSRTFVGLTVHETLTQLLELDQLKLAEKLKGDMKVSDRRFAWLRVMVMVKRQQWDEVKKFARQKRSPLPSHQVVRLVREHAGDDRAKEFLTEEFVANSSDRVNLFMDFGMFVEAANAAFTAKSIDSLNTLETVCAGRDDILRTIKSLKTKLLSK